jgi:hypothetical protein
MAVIFASATDAETAALKIQAYQQNWDCAAAILDTTLSRARGKCQLYVRSVLAQAIQKHLALDGLY